jgi:hypothetical protein
MTTYAIVAQALVEAGYLTDADIDAAVDILADALVVDEAEEVEAAAIEDAFDQEDVIDAAEALAEEHSSRGNWDAVDDDEAIIDEAKARFEADVDIIAAAENTIDAAYADAAAALLTAELIDEATVDDAAVVIANAWVVEDD